MTNNKVGLLIDVENIRLYCHNALPKEFDVNVVVKKVRELGSLVLGRAYFALGKEEYDFKRGSRCLPDWFIFKYFKHGIEVVPVPTIGKIGSGKNMADPYIITDAMEYLFRYNEIDTWVIVTGDKDFIFLIRKMRLYGKNVVVIGPEPSEHKFRYLYEECNRLGVDYYAYDDLLPAEKVVQMSMPEVM